MKLLRMNSKGFTLIELLVTLTIVTILAVSIFVALNPSQRLKDSKDARRATDVDSILSAIHQSIVDNKGTLPTNLAGLAVNTEAQLGTAGTLCTLTSTSTNPSCNVTAAACTDLMAGAQNLAPYLKSMPFDPATGNDAQRTGYSIVKDTNGIIQVRACRTDGTTTITASR